MGELCTWPFCLIKFQSHCHSCHRHNLYQSSKVCCMIALLYVENPALRRIACAFWHLQLNIRNSLYADWDLFFAWDKIMVCVLNLKYSLFYSLSTDLFLMLLNYQRNNTPDNPQYIFLYCIHCTMVFIFTYSRQQTAWKHIFTIQDHCGELRHWLYKPRGVAWVVPPVQSHRAQISEGRINSEEGKKKSINNKVIIHFKK